MHSALIQIAIRWRHLRQRWSVVGLLLVSTLLWSGCINPVCSDEERAVLAEFPQYGDVQVTPEDNVDTGTCAVYYDVPDPPEQVRRYFVEQLSAHGWTVEPPYDLEGQGGTLVEARRGRFFYFIYYESLELYATPRPGTHLAVHVTRG